MLFAKINKKDIEDMLRVTKIRMRPSSYWSNSLLEIDDLFIQGTDKYLNSWSGYYDKEKIHDYLKDNPRSIKVEGYDTYILPKTSLYGEKYVASEANNTQVDNLLRLPRE